MAYTTIKKPSDYFNTVLYTGDGTNSRAVTGVGFQPDFSWLKNRTGATAYHHQTFDSVRGASAGALYTSLTGAEDTNYTISSFDSDGITLRATSHDSQNGNGVTFASWNWLANGTGVANTDGSITSTVSANTTSGFSIVSYTGNGTDGATVGHGLTSPKLVLIKDRDNATPWLMYGYPNHPAFPNDGSLIKLNESSAMVTDDLTTELSIGSSTVTFVDAGSAINGNLTNFIMYCFQEKQGFSKFGSYTGNGNADGTFVYTGFKPAFILMKRSDTGNSFDNWYIFDNKRDGFNPNNKKIAPNISDAESSDTGLFDLLSNGFKLRTTNSNNNGSGGNFIYMAFAEQPLVGDNPATAR